MINVGSLASRVMATAACYCLLDTDASAPRVTYRRVAYDFEHTAQKIEANPNLDNQLAARLRKGA